MWKGPKDIWKGEGIYHLTFVVVGRRPLLGELVTEFPDVSRPFYRNLTKRVPAVNERGELAMVRLSPFGKAVNDMLRRYDEEFYHCYQQAEWVVCDSKILRTGSSRRGNTFVNSNRQKREILREKWV